MMTARPLVRLAEKSQPGAAALPNRDARNVAVGVINLQQIITPGLFIIHGDTVKGGDDFRANIQRHVSAGVPPHPGGSPEVTFAQPRDEFTLLGAAGLVL